jgi:HD-GYP domain-containing protein (c-di-GMP phosphodiesterase class II)
LCEDTARTGKLVRALIALPRPYRDGLPAKAVFGMMAEDSRTRLDSECFTALKERRPEEVVNALAKATGA